MARYSQYSLERARRDASIRAADADREQVAERLRNAHVEGRLDLAEFQQRLDLCYDAKTMGDLAPLVRDLPRRRERNEAGWLGWLGRRRRLAAALATVVVASIVLGAIAGPHGSWHRGGGAGWLWIPVLFIVWRIFFWRWSPWRRRRGRFHPPQGPSGA